MKIKTLAMFLFIAIVFVACSPFTKSAPIAIPTSSWKTYSSETFLVTLEYPEYWEVDNSGNAVYSGQDGFFQISAASTYAPTAKEACENEIHVNNSGKQNSFGTNPGLEILRVDNQPACLILPSGDQPQDQHGLSVLVVEYPDLDQGHTRLLLFSADKDHIRNFISTLKFIH